MKTNDADRLHNLSPIPEDMRSVRSSRAQQLVEQIKNSSRIKDSQLDESEEINPNNLNLLAELKLVDPPDQRKDNYWRQNQPSCPNMLPMTFNHQLKYQYMAQTLAVSALSKLIIHLSPS